jgi:ArsR family transcriptional regulator, arsenate/arsenite/antimonite-responsive transcriptional repressor
MEVGLFANSIDKWVHMEYDIDKIKCHIILSIFKEVYMERNYADFALLFKALSDETRLKIVDMLSCGELCACDILKSFNITQPTLSYHMKILSECGVVNANRIGAWMHYTLNGDITKQIGEYWNALSCDKENCICNANKNSKGSECCTNNGGCDNVK